MLQPYLGRLTEFLPTFLSHTVSWALVPVTLSSYRVEEKVAVGSMGEAVEAFQELRELLEKLRGSRCSQLQTFVSSMCEQRRMQLKERLTR